MNNWSIERARGIEQQLIGLVKPLPTVLLPHGCSHEGYRDAKIVFHHAERTFSNGAYRAYFLEHQPDESRLVSWAGAIWDGVPSDVFDFLRNQFPNARLHDDYQSIPSNPRRPMRLNSPYLAPVSSEQLESVARQLLA